MGRETSSLSFDYRNFKGYRIVLISGWACKSDSVIVQF